MPENLTLYYMKDGYYKTVELSVLSAVYWLNRMKSFGISCYIR